ncbi:MAG: hypothetical protein H8E46_09860 [FCB group bacterium]|nr:hypothetical protein [FCB group bacterium]
MNITNNITHTFYIPVLGTGFSVDTALKVAKYGISSVISLVDDVLIEQMRKIHSEKFDETYEPISDLDRDARARRITLYLNLIGRVVHRQIEDMKNSPFNPGCDLVRYFELLPDVPLKQLYRKMLAETDPSIKNQMQDHLRALIVPGSIDVNIMTKMDMISNRGQKILVPENSSAMSALRGYALSDLHSSLIFSAGLNQRLYSYLTKFDDFLPDPDGELNKKVVLKVSDFRSAEIQGKFLAKRGIWVSEFRVESGLNCGGHSFPTTGSLLGPILEQFKNRKQELIEKHALICNKALTSAGRPCLNGAPGLKITVQGGIGSCSESELLLDYYNVDGTGWGTPFLLVPEVTNVDEAHLIKLAEATEQDVFLSNSSPLDVPFWNLKNSDSENARRHRISEGKPGSLCPKGYALTNTEFTEAPVCVASRTYQKLKLKSLNKEDYTEEQMPVVIGNVLGKSCICHDLAGSATIKNEIDPEAKPAICCGPNIVNFSKIMTLEDMVNHIYGRNNMLDRNNRPHMFIEELSLYIDNLRDEIEKYSLKLSTRKQKYFQEYKENLSNGIEYYRCKVEEYVKAEWDGFSEELLSLYYTVENIELIPIPTR